MVRKKTLSASSYTAGMAEFPSETRRIIRHSEKDPLFWLPKQTVFNPYESQDILTDFINIDTEDEASLLDFISRYGFPSSAEYICDSGSSYKRTQTETGEIVTFEKDESKPPIEEGKDSGKYDIYRAIDAGEYIKAIHLARACFEMSILLSSDLDETEKVRQIKEAYVIEAIEGKEGPSTLTIISKRVGRLNASIRYMPGTFSPVPEIDALYAFLLHVINWRLSDYGVSLALLLVEGQIQRANVPAALMGALWHMIADTVGSENRYRQCAARGCGKWFKYRNPAARVCSQACAKRLRRDELKAQADA